MHPLEHEPIEASLRDVLSFVDGHLKFAETKNAAVLAVCAAYIAAALQAEPSRWSSALLSAWYYNSLLFTGLAGVTAIVSFLPLTDRIFLWKQKVSENDNLLFFGDVQAHNERSYFEAFLTSKGVKQRPPTGMERMYAHQIVTNAKIAANKFGDFRAAAWLILMAALTPVGAGVLRGVLEYRGRYQQQAIVVPRR